MDISTLNLEPHQLEEFTRVANANGFIVEDGIVFYHVKSVYFDMTPEWRTSWHEKTWNDLRRLVSFKLPTYGEVSKSHSGSA